MNTQRRKQVRLIIRQLNDAVRDLQSVRDEEDEARENMPENFHDTDQYLDSETASETMDDIIDTIDAAISLLEEIS